MKSVAKSMQTRDVKYNDEKLCKNGDKNQIIFIPFMFQKERSAITNIKSLNDE